MIKDASKGSIKFVKFKISNNFKQKIVETDSKQPKIPISLWILEISKKNLRTKSLQTFAKSSRFPIKINRLGMDLKSTEIENQG
jgi:hypothetical protein